VLWETRLLWEQKKQFESDIGYLLSATFVVYFVRRVNMEPGILKRLGKIFGVILLLVGGFLFAYFIVAPGCPLIDVALAPFIVIGAMCGLTLLAGIVMGLASIYCYIIYGTSNVLKIMDRHEQAKLEKPKKIILEKEVIEKIKAPVKKNKRLLQAEKDKDFITAYENLNKEIHPSVDTY
jgi:amino acid transporter